MTKRKGMATGVYGASRRTALRDFRHYAEEGIEGAAELAQVVATELRKDAHLDKIVARWGPGPQRFRIRKDEKQQPDA